MKVRKIPMRRCLVSREQFPKSELIRIVCDKDKLEKYQWNEYEIGGKRAQ